MEVIENRNFSGLDLRKKDIIYRHFKSCTFESCDFSQARIAGCTFDGCTFSHCDFSRSTIYQCESVYDGQPSRFSDCFFLMALIRVVTMNGAEFEGCDLGGAFIMTFNISSTIWKNCDLTFTFMKFVRGTGIRLSGSTFFGTTLHDCCLRVANMSDCAFDINEIYLENMKKEEPDMPEDLHAVGDLRELPERPDLTEGPMRLSTMSDEDYRNLIKRTQALFYEATYSYKLPKPDQLDALSELIEKAKEKDVVETFEDEYEGFVFDDDEFLFDDDDYDYDVDNDEF